MTHLTQADLRLWLDAVRYRPLSSEYLLPWLEGPLRRFFPYRGFILGHGELDAGQLKLTHMLASGHEEAYLHRIGNTFELAQRGSLKWWLASRQPFYIDLEAPPFHASDFELDEIAQFGLGNVAIHGVLNLKSTAGTYFGFAGVKEPLGEWHLEALRLMAPVLNDLLLCHFSPEPEQLPALLHTLSQRQKAIVYHLAAGLRPKAIAQALGLTVVAVRTQIAAIYARAGVHKQADLIAMLK